MKTLKLYYTWDIDRYKFHDKTGNSYAFSMTSLPEDFSNFYSLLSIMCDYAKDMGLDYIQVKINDIYPYQYNYKGSRIIEVKSSITGKYSLKTPRFMEFV